MYGHKWAKVNNKYNENDKFLFMINVSVMSTATTAFQL